MPMPPEIIKNRREYNDLMGSLRRDIISAYNTLLSVRADFEKGPLTEELCLTLLSKIKSAGRMMVETKIYIKKMIANAKAVEAVYLKFFGRNGPGDDIIRMAGINTTTAIESLLPKLDEYLDGCDRELERLKEMAELLNKAAAALSE